MITLKQFLNQCDDTTIISIYADKRHVTLGQAGVIRNRQLGKKELNNTNVYHVSTDVEGIDSTKVIKNITAGDGRLEKCIRIEL